MCQDRVMVPRGTEPLFYLCSIICYSITERGVDEKAAGVRRDNGGPCRDGDRGGRAKLYRDVGQTSEAGEAQRQSTRGATLE